MAALLTTVLTSERGAAVPTPSVELEAASYDTSGTPTAFNLWICVTSVPACSQANQGVLTVWVKVKNVSTGDRDADQLADGLAKYEFYVSYNSSALASVTPCDYTFIPIGVGSSRGPIDQVDASVYPCVYDEQGSLSGGCSRTFGSENSFRFECATVGFTPGATGDFTLAYLLLIPRPPTVVYEDTEHYSVSTLRLDGCRLVDPYGGVVDGSINGVAPVCNDLIVTTRWLVNDFNFDCSVDIQDAQLVDNPDLNYMGSTCQNPIPSQLPIFVPPAVDGDDDDFFDYAKVTHTGPVNADPNFDNCLGVSNPDQANAEGNFVDNSPPANPSNDDRTWPNSDGMGNACDDDDDNDGLGDSQELTGEACGGTTTDPLVRDTDADRFLDGVECALGTDPTSGASKPTAAQCASAIGVSISTDSDGDRVKDYIEFCFYNSNRFSNDTDGDRTLDGATDGCEAASLNGDRVVNAGDQLLMVLEILREVSPSLRLVSYDINKDGAVNAGDQLILATFIAPSGQCP